MAQNMTPQAVISLFEAALRRALTSLNLPTDEITLSFEHPNDPTHGDWSSNVAMQAFGRYRDSLEGINSPRDLAQALVNAMDDLNEVATLSVAGPGFINFTLSPTVYLEYVDTIVNDGPTVVLSSFGSGKTAVVEFSSPNIAKPFTVGHLRSTIIGNAVANILMASGFEVKKDNHLGDWGTQFGKQICAIKKWDPELKDIESSDRPVKKLVELYVRFHKEAEEDPSLVDEGREWFKKLENGDEEARGLWQKCIDWSCQEFDKIYHELGVTFTENGGQGYGESYFEDKMDSVVEELSEKGLLTDSEGAKLVFFPDDKYPPLMIIKQNGTTLYATRDLATDKFRLQEYGSDVTIINEVGAEQSLYFQQLFATEELLGWVKPGQRVHVKHGMFRFKDGKMSTRKGNVIWLEDVLAEAKDRAKTLQKENDGAVDISSEVGIGALKWNDLKRSAHLDVVFDWDEMLTMEGNSGPYMQYAVVRCRSVLDKWNESGFSTSPTESDAVSPEALDVMRALSRYPEVVEHAAREYAPHHIATALFELAQLFNTFYNKHQIVQADVPAIRIELVQAVEAVLTHGLTLLGIETVDRM